MTEKKIEAWLGKQLKNLGCLYFKFVSPGNDGVPDRIIVLPGGMTIFVELKTDRGYLSPMQRYQLERLRNQGAGAYVVFGMDDAEALVRILQSAVKEVMPK